MLLLDTNILIDVLRGEAIALAWLEQQEHPGHQRDQLDRGAGGLPRG
jgi:predicted nucleic acid-binding protein